MIDRYSLPQFSKIWSTQSKYEKWLAVEFAILSALEQSSVIPCGIADKCAQIIIDIDKIEKIEMETKHDVVAFLQYVESQMGDDGRWVHYGLTSSDVVDTAFSLSLVESGREIEKLLDGVINTFIPLINEYKMLPMIGRTHGMHAEPITVGLFLARHLAEFKRNKSRLNDVIDVISVGKLSGAVGSCVHFSSTIESMALDKLALKPVISATQIIPRDIYAPYFMTLSLIAAAVERFALNIRHLHRSEVSEIREGFGSHQKGSSAMPHKRNPILCENLCGLSRYTRGMITPIIENCVLWHERDISHSSVERIVAPDMTTIVGFMLDRTMKLIQGLDINRRRILEPLDNINIYGEYVLLALVKAGLSRKCAHGIIQKYVSSGERGALLHILYDPQVKQLIEDGAITEDEIRRIIGIASQPQISQSISNIIDSIVG